MEYLDGVTLKHRIGGRPMEMDTVLDLGIQIADGLDVAHAEGSSTATSNLQTFLSPSAATPRFSTSAWPAGSIAPHRAGRRAFLDAHRRAGRTLTSPGVAVGTVAYMSPEQVRGKNWTRAPTSSHLAWCLYEMATGVLPFAATLRESSTDAILHQLLSLRCG